MAFFKTVYATNTREARLARESAQLGEGTGATPIMTPLGRAAAERSGGATSVGRPNNGR